jgi:large subunit ribosomal protein L30
MAKKLKIIQKRSVIDRPEPQKRTIKALGLGRPNYTVVHEDTPQIRGMIRKVIHLVEVEEVKQEINGTRYSQ